MKKEDLKEVLKDVLTDVLTGNTESLSKRVEKRLDDAIKEPVKISIEKLEDGSAKTNIEGTNMGILVTLAGLEKTILEQIEAPKEVWELVKNLVGTREAE